MCSSSRPFQDDFLHGEVEPLKARNASLDLVKWLAIFAMAIDHLRFVWPALSWSFVPGRLAFPLFCLAMAANICRLPAERILNYRTARYLGWLIAFSILSEWPFRHLIGGSTLNIFPTLAIGLVVAIGLHSSSRWGTVWCIFGIALALLLRDVLMYGAAGVLLPAALMFAVRNASTVWIGVGVCVVANLTSSETQNLIAGNVNAAAALGVAALAPILGVWLLLRPNLPSPPAVRRWAYWFYPVHLAILSGLGTL